MAGQKVRLGIEPALVVWVAGVSAALHVGKLSPALPVMQQDLGIGLLQAGFLLSMVQFAGMLLGLVIGLAADGLGLRRSMISGLLLLSVASLRGGWSQEVSTLLLLRAVEGFGFLLTSLPAPNLIRQLVGAARVNTMLGVWGAYMPLGTAAALLLGPPVISQLSWQAWWWCLGGWTLLMVFWLWREVPADARGLHPQADKTRSADPSWSVRLRQTLSRSGPWLVALSFAVYSGQWIAVIGFLPSIYAQAEWSVGLTAVLTALAALVNIGGNIASGRLLAVQVKPGYLLMVGFGVMGLGSVLAFAQTAEGAGLPTMLRYVAILLFSSVGGLIPGTLFSLTVRLAPSEHTVSTTVGWTQQWAATGQFVGPPVVAWVAGMAGGWHVTWVVTLACSLLGFVLAWRIGNLIESRP